MSAELKKLIDAWSLPNRTAERVQISLRLSYDLYARLHALKSVYPARSVNDLICDLLSTSIDEIVPLLPSRTYTKDDYEEEYMYCDPEMTPEEYRKPIGSLIGPAIDFKFAYRRILESKESKKELEGLIDSKKEEGLIDE